MLSRFRREGGQDLVEFALVMFFLAPLLFGIMELGIVIFSYNTIANAAREGARYGAVHCPTWSLTCNLADISKAASDWTVGLNQANLTITPTHPTGTIQVVVTYKVDLIPGLMGRPDITLQARSTMQTEGYPE